MRDGTHQQVLKHVQSGDVAVMVVVVVAAEVMVVVVVTIMGSAERQME